MPPARQAVAALFHDLHTQEKRTVVVVTHDEHFTEVASRVLKMDRGQLHV
jgi:ABC-type lipoprotein export system ATPase subunit